MAPIAPHLQRRRQPSLPLPPAPEKPGQATSTYAECEALYAYLRHKGVIGRERGLLKREVLVGFRTVVDYYVADRTLQRILADAPSYGFPLASSSSHGYFIVETLEDLDGCIDELMSRIHEHTQRVQSLTKLRERFTHEENSENRQGHPEGSGPARP